MSVECWLAWINWSGHLKSKWLHICALSRQESDYGLETARWCRRMRGLRRELHQVGDPWSHGCWAILGAFTVESDGFQDCFQGGGWRGCSILRRNWKLPNIARWLTNKLTFGGPCWQGLRDRKKPGQLKAECVRRKWAVAIECYTREHTVHAFCIIISCVNNNPHYYGYRRLSQYSCAAWPEDFRSAFGTSCHICFFTARLN